MTRKGLKLKIVKKLWKRESLAKNWYEVNKVVRKFGATESMLLPIPEKYIKKFESKEK